MTTDPMPKPRTNAGWMAVILIAVVVLLPVAYMGTYYATVDADDSRLLPGPPVYHLGADGVERFFAPAHYIDKHFVRPSTWWEVGTIDIEVEVVEDRGHPVLQYRKIEVNVRSDP